MQAISVACPRVLRKAPLHGMYYYYYEVFHWEGKVSHTIAGLWDKPGKRRMRGGMSFQLKASTSKLAANQKEILSLYCCQFQFAGKCHLVILITMHKKAKK